MSKKVISILMLTLIFLTAFSGLGFAQSGTYTTPPTEPEPTVPTPTPVTGPTVPSDWIKIPMLDKSELVLTLGGPSVIINATIPTGFGSPTLGWSSSNTNVITVVANSPATVTPVGLGNAYAIVTLTHEGTTYYDFTDVKVIAAGGVATPPTSGGSALALYIFAGLLFLTALPPLYKSRLEA